MANLLPGDDIPSADVLLEQIVTGKAQCFKKHYAFLRANDINPEEAAKWTQLKMGYMMTTTTAAASEPLHQHQNSTSQFFYRIIDASKCPIGEEHVFFGLERNDVPISAYESSFRKISVILHPDKNVTKTKSERQLNEQNFIALTQLLDRIRERREHHH
jgi:hypothetical protein